MWQGLGEHLPKEGEMNEWLRGWARDGGRQRAWKGGKESKGEGGRESGKKEFKGQASRGRFEFYLASSRSIPKVPLSAKLQFSIWILLATLKDNSF